MAAGPRAGDATATAVNVRVSPLAIVPASVIDTLNGVTGNVGVPAIDSSLGNASLQVDYTNVKGSLGSSSVYGASEAHSLPLIVDVRAIATLMNVLQTELNNLGAGAALPAVEAQLQTLETALGPALGAYLNAANQLATQGHFEVPALNVSYPGCAASCSASSSVIPAVSDPSGLTNVVQLQSLAPYTATASDGDTTAKHTVEATSSIDALSLVNNPAIPLNLSATSALATLQNLINTLEAALPPAVASAIPSTPVSQVTGLVNTVPGVGNTVVGTVSGTVNTLVPAGTPVSTVLSTLQDLLNLKAALNGLNTSIDLSQLVQTSGVASDVSTTVNGGAVHSISTTKAADVKIVGVNAPQLSSVLGVAQGSALAEIIGAQSIAETTANGQDSHASGSGQFTEIKLLPGSALASSLPYGGDIKYQDLQQIAGCGNGSECTLTAGPLQVVISTGVCACTDAHTNGGTADAASATVSALEVKVNYLGGLSNLLLGAGSLSVPNPAGPVQVSSPVTLADVQLATAAANSGQHFSADVASPPNTGSPYGTGLLVGFLLLAAAAGMGVTYRRLVATRAGRS